jgi:hypothetical protein
MNNRSIINVIPFGDQTEEELLQTAQDAGLSVAQTYAEGQQPIGEVNPGTKTNPENLVPGVSKRYWIPIGALALAIQPMSDGAFASATSNSLSEIIKGLNRVLDTLKRNAQKLTPAEWEKMERTRIAEYTRNKEKAGRVPDPEMLKVKPMEDIWLKTTYWKGIRKLTQWLKDPMKLKPPFAIFTEGSIKLPFFQWSTVPGITCPGAGKCWDQKPSSIKVDSQGNASRNVTSTPDKAYCYSLNGWRQIYPYLRQLQNTILTRIPDKSHIERDLLRVQKKNPRAVVRLFVDGDFDSLETLEFWMHTCRRFPEMQFYGYSKSWKLFLDYDKKHEGNWPDNYTLNLSNGTIWETLGGAIYDQMADRMMKLKCVRGRFIAIKEVYRRDADGRVMTRRNPKTGKEEPIQSVMPALSEKLAKDEADPRFHPSIAAEWDQHRRDLLLRAKEVGLVDAFSCPGKCYACLGPKIGTDKWVETTKEGGYGRHACGEIGFRRPIVIAVH